MKEIIENTERWAKALTKATGYQPGGDLFDLVARLGGKIEYTSDPEQLEPGVSGSIDVRGPGDFTILLPNHTSINRDRFTVGHELGHYFIHSEAGGRPQRYWRDGTTDSYLEWEANAFSGAFLMPAAKLRELSEQIPNRPDLYAKYFQVSRKALDVRCQILNIPLE